MEFMSINLRLGLGFAVVLFMMVVLTVIGISRVNFIDSTITQITDVNSVKQRYAINFRGSVHDRAISIRDVVFSRTTNDLNKEVDMINKLDDFYQESASSMNSILSSGDMFTSEEESIYSKIKDIEKKTRPLIQQVIDAQRNDNLVTANKILLEQARPLFVTWLAAINQFIDYQETINQEATKNIRLVTSSFQNWMLSLDRKSVV